ncbi:MFS transporter, partial [Micrococcus luteus]
VLSFASLMGSSGGVEVQPLLGWTADLYVYPASLALGGAVQLLAAPFIVLSRRRRSPADVAAGLAAP